MGFLLDSGKMRLLMTVTTRHELFDVEEGAGNVDVFFVFCRCCLLNTISSDLYSKRGKAESKPDQRAW